MKKSFFFLFFLLLFYQVSLSGNIIVGTKSYPVDTLSHYKIGPGSYYTALHLMDAAKPLRVFFLEVDAKNPYISMKTVLGKDSTITCERPSDMAKRKTTTGAMYIGGTNADFFVTAGQVGLPVAGCMVNGEIGLIPNSRPDIAFDRAIAPYIGKKIFVGSVTSGTNSFSITNVNTTRSTNQLILYNNLNGRYTHSNAFGTEVLVQLVDAKWDVNKPVKVKVVNVVSGVGNMFIPAGNAVLSGHGTAQTFLNALQVNDEIDVNLGITIGSTVKPSLTDMVGGDRFILENGQVSDTDWAELHPRTAVGYSADKSKIYFCVVDGRSLLSVGVTTKQLADIMKSAGAYTALNLDGGGSSCMYVKEFNVMNTGSDGVERAVANGLFAVSSAPTDATISEINAYQNTIELPKFGVFKPKFLGYNQYGTLLNTDVQGVQLSCSSELGYINSNGQLVASGSQGGVLVANFNGIRANVNVVLRDEAEIKIRLDSVLMDSRFEYPIEVQSIIGQNTMQVLPSALTWTVEHPEICSVVNGILKGLSNGTTKVFGNLGSFKDTLMVKVEIPVSSTVIHDRFNDLSSWVMTPSATNWNATMTSTGLPANWTHGAAIQYVYKSARMPSIKLSKLMKMYSLPDSIKLLLNTGNVDVSRLIICMRANNQSSGIVTSFNNLLKNSDREIIIPASAIATNAKDIASYPIWFDYMTLYINTATQVADVSYSICLKEIALYYKGLTLGINNPALLSKLIVYPNPLNGTDNMLSIKNTSEQKIHIQLFDLLGKQVFSTDMGTQPVGEVKLTLPILIRGSYLLKIKQGELFETIKLIKN